MYSSAFQLHIPTIESLSLSFIISICGKTILISLNSLNEHPIDENIVEYTLMLMDLMPITTIRTAELIMSRIH